MSLDFPADGVGCAWLFDPATQALLESKINYSFALSFSATKVDMSTPPITTTYTASASFNQDITRVAWNPAFLDTDPSHIPIPADSLSIARQGCSPSCWPGTVFADNITAEGLWSVGFQSDHTFTGAFSNSSITTATPPVSCSHTNDMPVSVFMELRVPMGSVVTADVLQCRLSFAAGITGFLCVTEADIAPAMSGDTGWFDLTMSTLAELVGTHTITTTPANPGGYATWALSSTVTFTCS